MLLPSTILFIQTPFSSAFRGTAASFFFLFLKLLFVLKTKPHDLVKTGASQQGGKDGKKMMKRSGIRMRRRLDD